MWTVQHQTGFQVVLHFCSIERSIFKRSRSYWVIWQPPVLSLSLTKTDEHDNKWACICGFTTCNFFNSVVYTGMPITWYAIGNRTFYGGFLIDARYVKERNTFLRGCFLSISEKYLGFAGDHSVVDCFELKHAIFVKSCANSATVIGQESHLCQYMFMLKANWLINQSK